MTQASSQKAPTPQAAVQQGVAVDASAARPDALYATRAEIRDQLKELRTRRNELSEQRAVVDEPQRKLIDTRIANIDQRSTQLETQLFAVNDQIAQGIPATVPTPIADASTTQAEPVLAENVSLVVQDAVFEAVGMTTMAMLSIFVVYRGFRRFIWKTQPAPALRDYSAQMNQLQQSMDVIALEVERISEAQRYTAKLLSEKGEKVPAIKG